MWFKYCKSLQTCPLVNTHDKLNEAFYFLLTLLSYYHNADLFRYHLNWFIQSLRNITWILQKEKHKIPNFDKRYKTQQKVMESNAILKLFVNARNIVVKKWMLESKSKLWVGVFRWRKLKLAILNEIRNPFIDSVTILKDFKKSGLWWIACNGNVVREQIGVQRTWIVTELWEDEIVGVCYEAFKSIYQVIDDAHKTMKYKLPKLVKESDINIQARKYTILLETDINPNLIKKRWRNK